MLRASGAKSHGHADVLDDGSQVSARIAREAVHAPASLMTGRHCGTDLLTGASCALHYTL